MEHQDPFEVLSTEELLAAGLICDADMEQLFSSPWSAADQQAMDYANYCEQQAQLEAEEAELMELAA